MGSASTVQGQHHHSTGLKCPVPQSPWSCPLGLLYVPTEMGNCVTILSTANFTSTNYAIYTCCKQLFARWVCSRETGRVWSCAILPGD